MEPSLQPTNTHPKFYFSEINGAKSGKKQMFVEEEKKLRDLMTEFDSQVEEVPTKDGKKLACVVKEQTFLLTHNSVPAGSPQLIKNLVFRESDCDPEKNMIIFQTIKTTYSY
jgi:hypothetical protein